MEIILNDPFAPELMKAQTALMQVIDPELFVNIIDLGLVYGVDFSEMGMTTVTMTLSTPHCPLGEAIMNGVRNALGKAFPDREIKVDIVWEPAWGYHLISDEGKAKLGLE